MLAVGSPSDTVYMAFSQDSMNILLTGFYDSDSLILTRKTLPSGDYVWNREDDDTPNVLHQWKMDDISSWKIML